MKKWVCNLKLDLTLSADQLRRDPGHYGGHFKDLDNPTLEEVSSYFKWYQEELAGSNDGGEMLANARMTITEEVLT